MNKEIANALYGYIDVLYKINQKLLMLCGANVYRENFGFREEILDIIRDIPRLIPLKYDNKNEKLSLSNRDGMMEFEKELAYLRPLYQEILDANSKLLNDIRELRNKYEHKMHGIDITGAVTGGVINNVFCFQTSDVDRIRIRIKDLISFTKMLNNLFAKIIDETVEWVEKDEELMKYPYYHKICRFSFKEFNRLYENEDLEIIGKLMRKF